MHVRARVCVCVFASWQGHIGMCVSLGERVYMYHAHFAVYKCVMPPRLISHVAYVHGLFFSFFLVLPPCVCASFKKKILPYMNASCHICASEWVILQWRVHIYSWVLPSFFCASYKTYKMKRNAFVCFIRSIYESCHTSMSHVTYMNASYYMCTWLCTHERGGRVGLTALSHSTHINTQIHTTTHGLLVFVGERGHWCEEKKRLCMNE